MKERKKAEKKNYFKFSPEINQYFIYFNIAVSELWITSEEASFCTNALFIIVLIICTVQDIDLWSGGVSEIPAEGNK